jgi:uncharacterized damage-inducible protein DinB
MSSLQPWFERMFAFDMPNSRFPNVLERLRGTPLRLQERLSCAGSATLVARIDDKWSMQENAGHLCNLEPLWIRRAEQLLEGMSELAVADLSNRGTDEAHYNERSLSELFETFRTLRAKLMMTLENAPPSSLELSARHPRLGTPMRLIDVAFFTAEHDDHHLARITELLRLAK